MSDDQALREVVIAKKTIEAHNMASFELVPSDGQDLPAFTPGSHIDVNIPGGFTRQYSLANPSSERHRYLIGIWRDANSRGGSTALYDTAKEGDRLQISPPRNRFRVPSKTARALLIARGIGATVVLSIADYLKAANMPFEFHYVFAGMSPGSFKPLIDSSPYAKNSRYYLELSVDNQLINLPEILEGKPEDTQLFICGADWWQDPIIKLAKEKYGFSDQRIHSERFTAKLAVPPLDRAFNITIKNGGKVLNIPGEQSVSTYLNDHGVKVPTSCEQGLCGACKTRILEGEADHRDSGLTDVERADGFFLPCVSRGKTDLVLDL
ncbi:MAG TPA: PDR/VanB family oxidoreductase [Polyangiaceae bacterium]